MTLLVTVLGAVAVGMALSVAVAVRTMRRLDHRCAERTMPSSCERCAAVLRGEDRGGHLVCACGAASPHLAGADLLAWSAEHHGEQLPALPGTAPEAVRSTTRGRAAAEAEGRVRQGLDEELSETQRRMIDRARRKPDPITPQLLRQAEEFGVRPPTTAAAPEPPAVAEAAEAAPETPSP